MAERGPCSEKIHRPDIQSSLTCVGNNYATLQVASQELRQAEAERGQLDRAIEDLQASEKKQVAELKLLQRKLLTSTEKHVAREVRGGRPVYQESDGLLYIKVEPFKEEWLLFLDL